MIARVVVVAVFVGGSPLATGAVALAADEHAAAHAEDEHAAASEPNPLAVDLDLAWWTVVVFFALFWVLSKFAWPQIAAALDERERKIADNIAAAAAKNEEAKQMLVDYEVKLSSAAGEVRAMLEEARRDAEVTKSRIAAEARQVAEEEKARALREIERAKNGAMQELAHVSADIAIDLARRVVREDLKADRQSQLVRDALGMIAATNPSKN
jgi:F-type H+-transporting ATPase subunit b